MDEQKKQIEALIEKSTKANTAHDAMQYTQAALNAANALCSLRAALDRK